MNRRPLLRPRALVLLASLALACGGAAAGDGDKKGEWGGKKGEWGGKKGEGGKRGAGGKGGKKGDDALPVAVTRAEPATIQRFYRTSGTLRALRSAELVATQAGVVLELLAEEGDKVEEGQVLARLDGRAFQLQAARDNVTARNAETELRRLEQIAKLDAVSREELDKQRYAVEQALAASKVSRHQIAQTKVSAPFAGTIVARLVDVGNMANQATTLYSIADMSMLDLDIHIPEADAGEVQVGSEVALEMLGGEKFTAKVIRRAPIVDSLTGTVKFVARAEAFPASAVPGAFCRARVQVASREAALSLPVTAIFDFEGKPHIYVVVEGKAKRQAVTLGLRGDERVEVSDGLDPGATVIADASGGIVEGMPVRPLGEGGPPAAGEGAGETGAAGALPRGEGEGKRGRGRGERGERGERGGAERGGGERGGGERRKAQGEEK
ncbi:MAG: efflux RND transporter periplasmic adaptor subunit [Myxococcales bacterium]|nr:efflux RND transporter periplasmic adaptor subunit [Myxococcales bacterium]